MFKGVYTALVTPFKNGNVDFDSLGQLVDQQVGGGIQGLVVCGTTGESATLTEEEQFQVLDFVCKRVEGKVSIIFGSGSNNTAKTIQISKKACEFPIDALLVVVPYYNKPPQEGMIAHFEAVADEVSKPIILYNVPGRTVASLQPDSIIHLSKHKNITGIKEADADLNNFSKYKNQVPSDFSLLSGDDPSCVNFCFLGGHGVISVCSHVAPDKMTQWIGKAIEKDETVRETFRMQLRWIEGLYVTSNPIPVKHAMMRKRVIESDEMRLPLTTISSEAREKMNVAFNDFKDLLS